MSLRTNLKQTNPLNRMHGKFCGFKKTALVFGALAFIINCTIISAAPNLKMHSQNAASAKSKSFAAIRDSITLKILSFEPEEWRILGAESVAGQLKDWSPAAIKAEVEFCRKSIKRLESAKTSNPSEKLDKQILLAHLKYLEYYLGRYHGELGNLQISIYPYDLFQYEMERFEVLETPDAKSALNHFGAIEGILQKIPAYLKQQEANLLAGLKLRNPDELILAELLNRIDSPVKGKSVRDGMRKLEEKLESEKVKSLLPKEKRETIKSLIKPAAEAYKSHVDFLNRKIKPKATEAWALGKEDYDHRFALVYGDDVSIEELVSKAEAKLAELNEKMVLLARELRPNLSLNETLTELRSSHFDTGEELLEAYQNIQKRIDETLTREIGLPTNAQMFRSAPPGVRVDTATNWAAPLLLKGLGIVLVNTSPEGLEDNSKVELPWVTIHEGSPGHASQSVLFQEAFNKGKVPLCRFLNIPDEVGYVRGNWYAMANIEGWALYTERLLLESNLLTREERLASLSGQARRAARVVVDVRMHSGGWSRQQVEKYLVDKAGLSKKSAQEQSLRYSRLPLQAVSYFFGAEHFEELHDKYKERLGKQFYRQLLSLGPVPPKLIREYFESSNTLSR